MLGTLAACRQHTSYTVPFAFSVVRQHTHTHTNEPKMFVFGVWFGLYGVSGPSNIQSTENTVNIRNECEKEKESPLLCT